MAFVTSAFAGLFIVGETATAVGDLIVTDDDVYIVNNLQQYVDGDVVVTDGTLKIIDGTLSIISNYDQRHTVTVGSGGMLVLDHGVLTTHLDQINPWPELELIVQDGGTVMATNDSMLSFPGGITLSNGAEVVLRDTTVTSLPGTEVAAYVVGSSGLITLDSADDGPEITVTDSTLKLFDSTIDALPEYPTDGLAASNLTLNGESTLLAVNSYLGVDFGPALSPAHWTTHNVLVVNDDSRAYMYGTHFEPYSGTLADRASAVVVSGVSSDPAVPATKGADNTGADIGALAAADAWAYLVEAGETMEIASWDAGPLPDVTPISSAYLLATYSVDPTYDGTNAVEWRADMGAYASTTIVPDDTDAPGTVAVYELPTTTLPDVGAIRTMDVRFINGASTGSVQFDNLWVVFTIGGGAYVYRWLNTTVGDEYGVPIPDATISAVFTGSTALEGQEAFYYTADGISTSPDADVLDHMGATSESFRTTGPDGRAVIPYLTDIIVNDGSANSQFVGSYAFTGSAEIDSVVRSSTESFSFSAYPAMEIGDQRADLTVEIQGVSVSSPDDSRWLVVPLASGETTLVVEDMNYYHAGDVIVASDGELIFVDSEFQLVQEYPNQRTIYVDGDGRLVFQDSLVVSDMPIDIIVQGHGTLEVVDSGLTGVSIVAKEDATVILDGSTISGGGITTSWNSRASLSIYDCVLSQAPVLSGYSVGSFTNTSVPSIEVEDDAVGLIYRWIHVTVYDGNSKPLPNAVVNARFYLNETFWTSSISDSSGVAKLNSLGTILTSSGSTYVGNYRVNATYTYGAVYTSDQEVSVGVMPYTEPLGKNATYALLTISDALPDLEVGTSSILFSPESPKNGQATTVTAMVENTGVSVAYDVLVKFYDDGELFATVVHPSIAPGTVAEVSAVWIADEPLSPLHHTIMVEVDPDDTITELDDSAAVAYRNIYVQNLPDIELSMGFGAYTVPGEPVVNTTCEVVAKVYNSGDNTASNVVVSFYLAPIDMVSPENLIGEYTITSIAPGIMADATVSWEPNETGTQVISVLANEDQSVPEISYANNNVTFDVLVHDYPDLVLSDFVFVGGQSTVAGGDSVLVRATLRNLEPAPVSNPLVALYIDSTDGEPVGETTIVGTFMEGSGQGVVEFLYTAPMVTGTTLQEIILVANPYHDFMEQDFDNNEVSGTLTISDIRPELNVDTSSIYVTYDGSNVTGQMFGRTVNITVEVENTGARPAQNLDIEFGVRGSGDLNYTFPTVEDLEVPADDTLVVWHIWTISLTTPGSYWIWVSVDPDNAIEEADEANNYAEYAFSVVALDIDVEIYPTEYEYETGSSLVTQIIVTYAGEDAAVKNLPNVTVALYDGDNVAVTGTVQSSLQTDSSGSISVAPLIPAELESGSYRLGVSIQGETYYSETISITGEEGGGIPLMIWIAVIAAIVAVVVGFTVYTYIYGLGKLVECGECGAFIPAASKRCPKCGVEFEVGTMKCSECGAWVPSDVSECPNCGVKFVGETEGEDLDYLERMRNEYDAMVSEYRELAKEELGKRFSDKKFEEWWKAQPTYISFEDWLAKEEEKRKEGPVPCPVCGTMNPKESTVCHKCGTVFAAVKQPPSEEPPPGGEEPPAAGEEEPPRPPQTPPSQQRPPEGGAAPKTVIRRPIDRKVVPKKIIRTPVDKKKTDEDSNEGS